MYDGTFIIGRSSLFNRLPPMTVNLERSHAYVNAGSLVTIFVYGGRKSMAAFWAPAPNLLGAGGPPRRHRYILPPQEGGGRANMNDHV